VGKADLDNLVKFVLDAMGGVAFADDQQISKLTCKKVWDVGDGSTTCTLTELEE
jgi:Holliday junction resolvase RusA-like endonuclease